MAKRRDADPQPPPTRREKLAEARRKARLKRDSREKWIIDKLNRGMSITELAARQASAFAARGIRRAAGQPSQRGDDRRLRLDGRRQPQGGRSGGQDRQRDGPLSWASSEAREGAGQSAPARPARSGAARPCAAAGSEARWKSRCNRLKGSIRRWRLTEPAWRDGRLRRHALARVYFLTSGQAESASLPNASSPFIVLRSL
jgi:hypothetical protein